MLGPIDYIIVSFKENNFDGSILKTINEAVDKKIINLLALELISKDAYGNIKKLGVKDTKDPYVIQYYKSYGKDSIIRPEDIDEVAELMDNNSAAGLLIIEQLWAKPLKKALLKTNGTLIGEGRIHPEAAEELDTKKED